MPSFRIPIWSLMIAVAVVALYAGGVRVLMQPQVGGDAQAAAKIWVGFGPGSLTAIVVTVVGIVCDPEARAVWSSLDDAARPIPEADEPEPIHDEPLGLVEGQRFRLPDGTQCRVLHCAQNPPRASLTCEPPRQWEEGGGVASESFHVDRDRVIWRDRSTDWGNRISFGSEATDWTREDLEEIT